MSEFQHGELECLQENKRIQIYKDDVHSFSNLLTYIPHLESNYLLSFVLLFIS
jgi:hypothetical protein